MRTLFIFLLVLFPVTSFAAGEGRLKPCQRPTEPAWFQDLTAAQKSKIDVDWEASATIGYFEIDGAYLEPAEEKGKYKEYKNEITIEAKEKWKCGKDKESEFVSMKGEYESELEWKTEEANRVETYEAEDTYAIKDIDKIFHVEHEHERVIKGKAGKVTKTIEEEEEWTQNWETAQAPYLKGEIEVETVIEISISKKKKERTKQLASLSGLPDGLFEKASSGGRMVQKTVEEGKYNGPQDLVEIEREQKVEVYSGDDIAFESELESEEKRVYKYDKKKKGFVFISSIEVSEEKQKKEDGTKWSETHKVSRWSDLSKAPYRVDYWREAESISKSGKMSIFTVSTTGHGGLPQLFDLKKAEGTLSRVTEFNEAGEIARFFVTYFPAGNEDNETKIDLNFNDHGKLDTFMVDDGQPNWLSDSPTITAKEFKVLRKRLAQVVAMENLNETRYLPEHEAKGINYPGLR